MIDYDWYSSEVEKLAKYPHAGGDSLASMFYPTLGMSGETSEVVQKVIEYGDSFTEEQVRAVTKELGDVLWYTTRVLNELGYTLESAVMNAVFPPERESLLRTALDLVVAVGRTTERVKKAIRDDDHGAGVLESPVGEPRRAEIRNDLLSVMGAFLNTCASLGVTIEDVAVANMKKLHDRHARGKLSGDGDTR